MTIQRNDILPPYLSVRPERITTRQRLVDLSVIASSAWGFEILGAAPRSISAVATEDHILLDIVDPNFYQVRVYLLGDPTNEVRVPVYKSSTQAMSEFAQAADIKAFWSLLPDCNTSRIPEIEAIWKGMVMKVADYYSKALADKVDFFSRKNQLIPSTYRATISAAEIRAQDIPVITPFRSFYITGTEFPIGSGTYRCACADGFGQFYPPAELVGQTITTSDGTGTVSSVDGKYILTDLAITPTIATSITVMPDGNYVESAAINPAIPYYWLNIPVPGLGVYRRFALTNPGYPNKLWMDEKVPPGTYTLVDMLEFIPVEITSGDTTEYARFPEVATVVPGPPVYGDGFVFRAMSKGAAIVKIDKTLPRREVIPIDSMKRQSWVQLSVAAVPRDIIRIGIQPIANPGRVSYFNLRVVAVDGTTAIVEPVVSYNGSFWGEEWYRISTELGISGLTYTFFEPGQVPSPAASSTVFHYTTDNGGTQVLEADSSLLKVISALSNPITLTSNLRLNLGSTTVTDAYSFSLWLDKIYSVKQVTSSGYIPALTGSAFYFEGRDYIQKSRMPLTGVFSERKFFPSDPGLLTLVRDGDTLEHGDAIYTVDGIASNFLRTAELPDDGEATVTLVRSNTQLRFFGERAEENLLAPVMVEDNRRYLNDTYGVLSGILLNNWTQHPRAISYTDALNVSRVAMVDGASLDNVLLAVNASLGLPLIPAAAYIEQVKTNGDGSMEVATREATASKVWDLPAPEAYNDELSGPIDGLSEAPFVYRTPLTKLVTVEDYLSGADIEGLARFNTYEVNINAKQIPADDIDDIVDYLQEYPSSAHTHVQVNATLKESDDIELQDEVSYEIEGGPIDDLGGPWQEAAMFDRSVGGISGGSFGDDGVILRATNPRPWVGTISYVDGRVPYWKLTCPLGGFTLGRSAPDYMDAGSICEPIIDYPTGTNHYDYVVIPSIKKCFIVSSILGDTEIAIDEVPSNYAITSWDPSLPGDTTVVYTDVAFTIVRKEEYLQVQTGATVTTAEYDAITDQTLITSSSDLISDGILPCDLFLNVFQLLTHSVLAVGRSEYELTLAANQFIVAGDAEASVGSPVYFVRPSARPTIKLSLAAVSCNTEVQEFPADPSTFVEDNLVRFSVIVPGLWPPGFLDPGDTVEITDNGNVVYAAIVVHAEKNGSDTIVYLSYPTPVILT